MSKKPDGSALLGALDDPEAAELMRETLEGLRRISQAVGPAQVVNALRASVALTNDPRLRTGFDELRSQLIGYARTIDDGTPPQEVADGSFRASPTLSRDDITVLLELLQSAGPDTSKPG